MFLLSSSFSFFSYVSRYNASTSKVLSLDLLQSGNVLFQGAKALRESLPPSDRRLGAIVIKDKLEVSIDVDWMWVKNNVDGLLSVKGLDTIILSNFGIDTHKATSSRSVIVPAPLIDNVIRVVRSNNTSKTFNQTIIERIRNSKVFNSTLNSGKQSATLRFDGISSSKEGLLLSSVEIERGGYSLNLGNVLLSSATIKSLLPDRTIGKSKRNH